jgi:hypothetical protein
MHNVDIVPLTVRLGVAKSGTSIPPPISSMDINPVLFSKFQGLCKVVVKDFSIFGLDGEDDIYVHLNMPQTYSQDISNNSLSTIVHHQAMIRSSYYNGAGFEYATPEAIQYQGGILDNASVVQFGDSRIEVQLKKRDGTLYTSTNWNTFEVTLQFYPLLIQKETF